MKALKVLIADDEPLARSGMRVILARDPEIGDIVECGNGREALRTLREAAPDIAFLDIQMPLLTGLQVVQKIGAAQMPPVIFVTAYDEFAVKAFELHAVDYLLKPFSNKRLAEALAIAKREAANREGSPLRERLEELLAHLEDEMGRGASAPGGAAPSSAPSPAPAFSDRIAVKASGDVLFLPVHDILWLEAQGDYVKLHTRQGSHLVRHTMHAFEERLDPALFARIHRSTIVNLRAIQRIAPADFGDYAVTLDNGAQLKLSRKFHHRFREWLGDA